MLAWVTKQVPDQLGLYSEAVAGRRGLVLAILKLLEVLRSSCQAQETDLKMTLRRKRVDVRTP